MHKHFLSKTSFTDGILDNDVKHEHKKFQGPSRPASIDGIVSDGRGLGVPAHRSYRPDKGPDTPSLDSLIRRSDGFHPMRQSASGSLGQLEGGLADVGAMLDEPIVLDEPAVKSKKKRRDPKHHKHPKLRKVLKRGSLALAALLILFGAFFGIKLYLTGKNIFKGGGSAPALNENIDINQLKGEGDGRINVLLLGIGGPGHDGPNLSDTILLVSIDPVNNTTALLSIPRDLWVKIPRHGTQKLNAAFAYGREESRSKDQSGKIKDGVKLVDSTLEPILGIPIQYHAVIDFTAFKKAVDSVGGIDVNVPEQLYDPTIAWENNYNSVIAKKGMQHMNGAKALLYAKSRETSSDFARGERQRLVIVALKDKILSAGTFSNPVKVSSLLSSLGSGIYTDFALNEIMRLYTIAGKIPSSAITSLDMVTPPHNLLTTANVNGLSIVQPRAGLFEYDDIKNYVRNALRDGFLARENSSVVVYNATDTVGLATKQGNTLKSFGYNVTTIDSLPTATNPPKTTIVDLSKGAGKYTRHYLEERFKVTAVTKLPAGLAVTPPVGTQFVIILGEDVTNNSN